MLEINISTILLQMANFVILAFILYRFLFKPLQNMLRQREKETTAAMDAAQVSREEAEAIRQLYEEKTHNIDAEIAARKNEARIVIEQTRQQMLREVQSEVEQLESQTEETLNRLRADAVQQHKQKLGYLASEFAHGIISGVMTPQLKQSYQQEFFKKVEAMSLSTYLEDTPLGETVFIRAIFAEHPPVEFKETFSSMVKNKLARDIQLTFEIDPSLIAGGILRFENELIDGSVQGQIKHLQERYLEMA